MFVWGILGENFLRFEIHDSTWIPGDFHSLSCAQRAVCKNRGLTDIFPKINEQLTQSSYVHHTSWPHHKRQSVHPMASPELYQGPPRAQLSLHERSFQLNPKITQHMPCASAQHASNLITPRCRLRRHRHPSHRLVVK